MLYFHILATSLYSKLKLCQIYLETMSKVPATIFGILTIKTHANIGYCKQDIWFHYMFDLTLLN